MKQAHRVLLLAFICFAFSQCGKQAALVDPNFVGVWNGNDGVCSYSLSIDNGSNGYWHQNNHGVFETAQGVARISHGKLHIALKSFVIDQYPAQDTLGKWKMKLTGVLYCRQ